MSENIANMSLDIKMLNGETLSTIQNENILKQLEEKNKSLENMKQLVDSLNKQRDSNEDTIKSLKANNNKLESKNRYNACGTCCNYNCINHIGWNLNKYVTWR